MTQTLTKKDKVLQLIEEGQPIRTSSIAALLKGELSPSYLSVILTNLRSDKRISKDQDGKWVTGSSPFPVGIQQLALSNSPLSRAILLLDETDLMQVRGILRDKFDYTAAVAKMYELYLLVSIIDHQPLDRLNQHMRESYPPPTSQEFMNALSRYFK